MPTLRVEAAIGPVGVRDDGHLTLPGDVTRPGWYRLGPVPGAAGSAVVTGHVDTLRRGLGVLAEPQETGTGGEIVVVAERIP